MKHLDRRCPPTSNPRAHLVMDFDARQKARSRVVASNGEVVGVHIKRGTSLKDGDCLTGDDKEVFMVSAECEPLSVVACTDPLDLARAAYHLGNRHVRLQVELGRLSYQTDHVLDDMVEQMGFSVEHHMLPFEPEPGAYHRHFHGEGHSHSHSHGEGHSHSHAQGDAHTHTHTHTHSHTQGASHSHSHHEEHVFEAESHRHRHTHEHDSRTTVRKESDDADGGNGEDHDPPRSSHRVAIWK